MASLKVFTVLFCMAFSSLAPIAQSEDANRGFKLKVGDMAPNFTVELTNGEQVTLSQLKGKVVMLQFTASWCSVCRKEMPYIEHRIWKRHAQNPNFRLIGLDKDEAPEVIKRFIQSTAVTYPIGNDKGSTVFELFAHPKAGVTRNVLIGSDGRIVMLTRLFNEAEFEELVAKIDELLQ